MKEQDSLDIMSEIIGKKNRFKLNVDTYGVVIFKSGERENIYNNLNFIIDAWIDYNKKNKKKQNKIFDTGNVIINLEEIELIIPIFLYYKFPIKGWETEEDKMRIKKFNINDFYGSN